jgi:flagellar export protein FliJ
MEPATLSRLIELATTARDAAAAKLARCERTLGRVRASLERLRGYAADYASRAQQQRQRGLDIATEINQRAFDAKLRQASEAQLQEVELHQSHAAAAAAELAQRERKLKSFEKLAAQRALALQLLDAQREQKLNDEIAGQMRVAFPLDAGGVSD